MEYKINIYKHFNLTNFLALAFSNISLLILINFPSYISAICLLILGGILILINYKRKSYNPIIILSSLQFLLIIIIGPLKFSHYLIFYLYIILSSLLLLHLGFLLFKQPLTNIVFNYKTYLKVLDHGLPALWVITYLILLISYIVIPYEKAQILSNIILLLFLGINYCINSGLYKIFFSLPSIITEKGIEYSLYRDKVKDFPNLLKHIEKAKNVGFADYASTFCPYSQLIEYKKDFHIIVVTKGKELLGYLCIDFSKELECDKAGINLSNIRRLGKVAEFGDLVINRPHNLNFDIYKNLFGYAIKQSLHRNISFIIILGSASKVKLFKKFGFIDILQYTLNLKDFIYYDEDNLHSLMFNLSRAVVAHPFKKDLQLKIREGFSPYHVEALYNFIVTKGLFKRKKDYQMKYKELSFIFESDMDSTNKHM
ncbi:hypothetical protein ABSA28_00750 [Candidatus Hepatincolaceae symbiont of Richtersius coronifer]